VVFNQVNTYKYTILYVPSNTQANTMYTTQTHLLSSCLTAIALSFASETALGDMAITKVQLFIKTHCLIFSCMLETCSVDSLSSDFKSLSILFLLLFSVAM